MTDDSLNDFMHGFITEVCDEIGPRAGTSEAERKAGDKIESILKEHCDNAYQEEFTCSPLACLRFVRYGALMIIIAVLFYSFSLYIDLGIFQLEAGYNLLFLILAICLVSFAVFYFIFEVMRMNEVIDFLFPKKKAKNIVGVIEPKGEIKNHVYFGAHHDSAPEYNLFYYLKWFGAAFIFIGFIGVLLSFVFIWMKFIVFFLPIDLTPWFERFNITLLCFMPVAAGFLFFTSKKHVPGAYDNLSGVSILLGIAKVMSKEKLSNTRVKLIAFACEEVGLRGSKRFVTAHLKELQETKAKVVNIDSISTKDMIVVVHKELFMGAKHDREMSDKLIEIGNNLNVGISLGTLPFGASDASPFTKKGIPATSFMSFELPKLPKFYHTRDDIPDVVEKESLGQVLDICIEYIKQIDESE